MQNGLRVAVAGAGLLTAQLFGGCSDTSSDVGGAGVSAPAGAGGAGAASVAGARAAGAGAAAQAGHAGHSAGANAAGGAGGNAAGGAGSSAGVGAPATAAGSGGVSGLGAAGSAGATASTASKLSAQIVATSIAPGAEDHVCVVVALDNPQPVWVNRIRADLEGGSHHLIVDRYDVGSQLTSTPTPCSPTMASDTSRLIIAQQKVTEVKLPEGVAFKLEAAQPIFLQLHYLNASESTHDIKGSVELFVAQELAQPLEAKSQFTGAFNINLPPHTQNSVQSFFTPQPNQQIFALTSHTHRLGTKATIERVNNQNAASVTPLHVSTDWAEPPLTQLDPPLKMDGTQGLRLTCQYDNTTNMTVTFGTEAHQEMCFMWLYYFESTK